MSRYDALVVGAGPAGSVTAYRLARAGARVLLVDRARFPRDKPCGGGLTVRAVRELPFSVDEVVEHVVDRFEVRLEYRRRFVRGGDAPLCLMTQRRRLDELLAARAADAGAEFRDGVRLEALEVNGAVTARVGGDAVRADFLVAADGVNGTTARAAGVDAPRHIGVALEGNVGHGRIDASRYDGRLVLEVGVVPGGYGWVFPKGDHVNVGIGGWEDEGPRLREHLRRLCRAHGIDDSSLTDVRGYRLPMRARDAPLGRGPMLLVGDAAGLVDPLSGDGMYEAFVSARLAADAIVADDSAAYPVSVERELGRAASTSWKAKLTLDRFPRLAFCLAPLVWGPVAALVRGDARHPGEIGGVAQVPLRALKALARSA